MHRNTLAVALAALAATALAVGGVAAAPASAPSSDAQPADRLTADDYEFTVVDHDDWLADRDADAAAVADLLFADSETGSELRALFEADDQLAIDVYGSLDADADAAHVIVTPAPGIDESVPSEQRPRVEATVDVADGSVDFVGASGASDAGTDAVTLNESEVDVTGSVTIDEGTDASFGVQTSDTDAVTLNESEVDVTGSVTIDEGTGDSFKIQTDDGSDDCRDSDA